MPKYESVTEYFHVDWPDLVSCLDNTGAFWPRVKENTIPNTELAKTILTSLAFGRYTSAVFQASAVLLAARSLGLVYDPD